jgi:hypothetical protein
LYDFCDKENHKACENKGEDKSRIAISIPARRNASE